jgi:hypothetical protein
VKGEERRLRAQVGVLRRDLARRDGFAEMVGSGGAMASVFRLMESAATVQIPVLIEGETGTGKELVGRGIHRASARAEGPFVAVNCAALPEALLESELFGHRRGAFTGAIQDKPGLFQTAHGGTLFLDEIAMPAAMRRLLRVLQEGEVMAVGDASRARRRPRVSATNRDLETEVEQATSARSLLPRRDVPDRPAAAARASRGRAAARRARAAGSAKRHGKRILASPPRSPPRAFCVARQRARARERSSARSPPRDGHEIGLEQLSRSSPAARRRAARPREAERRRRSPRSPDGPLRPVTRSRSPTSGRRWSSTPATSPTAQGSVSRVMLQKKMKEYGLRTPEMQRARPDREDAGLIAPRTGAVRCASFTSCSLEVPAAGGRAVRPVVISSAELERDLFGRGVGSCFRPG